MFAKTGSEKLEKTRLYRCGEYCAGGGAGQDSAMSKTGWLGLPLGVTFNRSSAVYARMQGWKSPTAGEMREALERVFSMQLPFCVSSECFESKIICQGRLARVQTSTGRG
jgi:hypothetical protein